MASGIQEKGGRSVHVIDGARTPFLKAKTGMGPFTGSDLAVSAGRALLLRQPFEATAFDEVIVGAAMPSADEANIARVVSLRPGLRRQGPGVDRDAQLRLGPAGARLGGGEHRRRALEPRARGGCDAMSHAPLLYGPAMVNWLAAWYAAKGAGTTRGARHALPPFHAGAGDRDPARAHRSHREALHGIDGGDRRPSASASRAR
jgi:acetyl-CoA C-acetyltransferase